MTQEELYKIASDSWEGCDGCNENDRMFWISGFMRAANLFGDIDNLPNAQQLEEKGQSMADRLKNHLDNITTEQFEQEISSIEAEGYNGLTMEEFINNQQNLDPEYGQIIEDNFWELTDDKTDSPYCPVCSGCGEDGCCSAMNCKQDPNGHYCGTYLNDLKFGYKMDKWTTDNLYHKMPKELQAEYDLAWDKMWDEVYENE